MRKRLNSLYLAGLILSAVCAGAQDSRRSMNPYLIPPVVYVGDRATLVIPLAADTGGKEAVLSLEERLFPLSPDIELRRVVLERRPAGSRLLVEFAAFTTGLLELPPIEIGGERFAGFRVTISSLISSDENGPVLAGPASPLAIPGTSLLVYGAMAGFMLVLIAGLWAGVWGRRHFAGWILKWKRRRLIVSMSGIEKRLRRTLPREGERRDILNTLSLEFRSFLSFFTGENCRAMTAGEMGCLQPELFALEKNRKGPEANHVNNQYDPWLELRSGFLGTFFRRCDELRFSGTAIAPDDVLILLGELRRFLKILDRAERGNVTRQGQDLRRREAV
jgi:hypothetical protein